ncbi:MAG: hypothetical protein KGJ33_01130 [Patescibacteria group bacterium]|nr:hypothetical protein [Patescibacteria group bacterium]
MFNTFLCSLLPFIFCGGPHFQVSPIRHWTVPDSASQWTVEERTVPSASSTEVIVSTGNNATTTTLTLNAPYGVKSQIVSENGQTYATTTPLTQSDVEQMQKQAEQEQADVQKQMDQMMQDQRKLFDDMQANFPF